MPMPHSFAVWLYEFCLWLDQTPLSQWIQVHGKSVVPTLQTIHILSIALVMTSALMIGLRLIRRRTNSVIASAAKQSPSGRAAEIASARSAGLAMTQTTK